MVVLAVVVCIVVAVGPPGKIVKIVCGPVGFVGCCLPGLGLSPKQSRHERALDRAADHGFGLADSANIYLCADFCEEEKPDPRVGSCGQVVGIWAQRSNCMYIQDGRGL